MTPIPADIPFSELAEGTLKHFTSSCEESGPTPSDPQKLRDVLAFRVQDLLDRDLERLTQVFYRADLSEAHVDRVFAQSTPGELPTALAELIIHREIARIRQRQSLDL